MTEYVESPPHVDEERIRHIRPADLLRGFGKPPFDGTDDLADDAAAVARRLRPDWARADHPRPAKDVARWAERGPSETELGSVLAAADALSDSGELDFTGQGVGRSRLYGLHYLGDLACLVQAHALTGEPRYAKDFSRLFDAWYRSRDHVRGEWPGLDVVWYSLGVSARSVLVGRALSRFAECADVSDQCWLRILATLVGSGRWLAEEHSTFRHGNWQFGAACALLQIAALVPDHVEAADWLAVARQRIEEHLVLDVYADGGHYERAPSYHALCLSMIQDAAIVAEGQFGWALAEEPKFTAMHDWLVAMSTADGWVPPFNDSHIVWTGEFLVTAHHLLDRPDYKRLVEQWVPADRIRSVLSWLPAREGRPDPFTAYQQAPAAPADRARSTWLAGSRFAVHRTGWTESDLQLTVNCGPMVEHELESHSHLAALDFVLTGNGGPLLWEAGGPASYDDPDYYTWYRSTAAHNTVIVPGGRLDEDHEATVEDHIVLPELDVFSGWQDGWGARHHRTLLLVHGPGVAPYLVVADEVDGADELVAMLHSPAAWQSDGPDRYRTGANTGVLVLGADPDRLVTARLTEGVASYPDPPGTSRYAPLYGLGREIRGPRARTVVVPFHDDVPRVDVEEAAGLTVRIDEHTDCFREHSWLRQRGARPVAGAAWRGDTLRAGERHLAGGPGVSAVSVRWEGGSTVATVDTAGRARIRLFAPRAIRVTVNGVLLPAFPGDGDEIAVALPSEGRWQIRVDANPE